MSATFVRTGSVLDRILEHKLGEVDEARRARPLRQLQDACESQAPARNFAAALELDTVALVAECKQASPSKGRLSDDYDPARLARAYAANGAAAISVLADAHFFQGSLDHLVEARAAVTVPLLCKEFVVDPWQVHAARASGADAVLLIVAALGDTQMAELHDMILALGMTPLVEVHSEDELERALNVRPRVIGVNNRDLKTFEVDLQTTARLARHVPPGTTLVAESGIANAQDVQHMGALGAHAVLVGETLMKAPDLAASVRSLSGIRREADS
ncbi:MAG: indole-3-glycerol phosphate synthase TrpC [Anaerolineaceae bacterium]|nr:indole-3-glycerol phosphate synthase TrpC [Anaerolineaceae bacterium]MDE0329931.1 indole-3-glycerol phosphate synthase TrpC [Anaerolineaceae bacterium]